MTDSNRRIPGFTSTGSKRPEALYGPPPWDDLPLRMTAASGCLVQDEDGREFLDFIMALGAVSLGYGRAEVLQAVREILPAGVAGPLPPVLEEEVAALLARHLPWMERVRFLKTGAEAVAAAVRLARTATRRDRVLGCGYHGWLDWCQVETAGVPAATAALFGTLPFNDSGAARAALRDQGDRIAAVVIEPVILAEPDVGWLQTLRDETRRCGAVLVFDEIKTGFRIAVGGAVERYGIRPDLVVLGKALANGFPLAAVGGRSEIMDQAGRTWISSTLAAETVSLAAARAAIRLTADRDVPGHLQRIGGRLLQGLHRLAAAHPALRCRAAGIPEMCHLEFTDERFSAALARGAARRGLLFKRSAYNFVSLAHGESEIDSALEVLAEVLEEMEREG